MNRRHVHFQHSAHECDSKKSKKNIKIVDWTNDVFGGGFTKMVCTNFVPVQDDKITVKRNLRCHCGTEYRDHIDSNTQFLDILCPEVNDFLNNGSETFPNVAWTESNIERFRTDSYGKIDFKDGDKKPAKYIRVGVQDDVNMVYNFMKTCWNILEPRKPDIVINVIGGAKNVKMSNRITKRFYRALSEVVDSTSAWIIASGFFIGIMRLIGEIVNDRQTFYYDSGHCRATHNIKYIGIGPWGNVKNRANLVIKPSSSSQNKLDRVYRVIYEDKVLPKMSYKPLPLDPNATHFLLVDNGYRNRLNGVGSVFDFVIRFLSTIAYKFKPALNVVTLMVNGGKSVFEDAKLCLSKNIPIVICEGTGRAADIFAEAYSKSNEKGDLKEDIKSQLKERITNIYSSWKSQDEVEKCFKNLLDCCKSKDLLTVFDVGREDDLSASFLQAIIKARKNNYSINDVFDLAFTCNKPDFVETELLNQGHMFTKKYLQEKLTDAIINDRSNFVRLLLKQRIRLSKYLTKKTLKTLYNSALIGTGKSHHFLRLLRNSSEKRENFTLGDVGKVLAKLIYLYDKNVYKDDESEKDTVDSYVPEVELQKSEFRNSTGSLPGMEAILASSSLSRTRFSALSSGSDNATDSYQAITASDITNDQKYFTLPPHSYTDEVDSGNGAAIDKYATYPGYNSLHRQNSLTHDVSEYSAAGDICGHFPTDTDKDNDYDSKTSIPNLLIDEITKNKLPVNANNNENESRMNAESNNRYSGMSGSLVKDNENISDDNGTTAMSARDSDDVSQEQNNSVNRTAGNINQSTLVRKFNDCMSELQLKVKGVKLYPDRELLIWAIFNNRFSLAKCFLEVSTQPISSALMASWLCKKILDSSDYSTDVEVVSSYKEMKIYFEKVAKGSLDEMAETYPLQAIEKIEDKISRWNGLSCLQIGTASDCYSFLASKTCQSYLKTKWLGKIRSPTWYLFLCTVLGLFFLVKFEKDRTSCSSSRLRSVSTKIRQSFVLFYSAPVVKYTLNTIMYIVFLLLFTYMVLFKLDVRINIIQCIVFLWVFSILADEIYRMGRFPFPSLRWKLDDNEGYMSVLFMLNSILLLITFFIHTYTRNFQRVRLIYCINLVIYYIRLLRAYTPSEYLGPKLYIITKALKELLLFFAILIVFLLAYGVASYTVLFPHLTQSWVAFGEALKHIFFIPYWHIYGELNLDIFSSDYECYARYNVSPHHIDENLRLPCRTESTIFLPLLLAVYLFFGNVLLLNLIIAIFSRIFTDIECNSKQVWQYQMYFYITDYDVKSYFPPPLNLIEYVFYFLSFSCQKLLNKPKKSLTKEDFYMRRKKMALRWLELETYRRYVRKQHEREENSAVSLAFVINERFNSMMMEQKDLAKSLHIKGGINQDDLQNVLTALSQDSFDGIVRLASVRRSTRKRSKEKVKDLSYDSEASMDLSDAEFDFENKESEKTQKVPFTSVVRKLMHHNKSKKKKKLKTLGESFELDEINGTDHVQL